MAIREQTVQELSYTVAQQWRDKKVYDKTPFRTMVARAIRGRGITDALDVAELKRRIVAECARRSASHSKAQAAKRKIA